MGVLGFVLQYINAQNAQIINKRTTKAATIPPIAPPVKPDFDGGRDVGEWLDVAGEVELIEDPLALLVVEPDGVFHIRSYQNLPTNTWLVDEGVEKRAVGNTILVNQLLEGERESYICVPGITSILLPCQFSYYNISYCTAMAHNCNLRSQWSRRRERKWWKAISTKITIMICSYWN
jgi:hypothetical protein